MSLVVAAAAGIKVKLVLSGQRKDVYVNHERAPSLRVGRLARTARSGTLELRGDATYANLDVQPGATAGLDPVPLPGPADADPRFVRRWRASARWRATPMSTTRRGRARTRRGR